MTIFTCEHNWDAMLCCIYAAFQSKKGHKNISLMLEPVYETTLFDEYIHVDADAQTASKMRNGISNSISYYFYREMMYVSMTYEEDVLDNIYRCLLLGFNYGEEILNAVQYKNIMRHHEMKKRLENEVCRFREFIRFHEIDKGIYVAHIEPKSPLVVALGPIFQDRMPSEHFVIVDDVHREAIVHRKDRPFFMVTLTESELERLKETEEANDSYTDLWKAFFESIAIEERKNEKCQLSHFPLWTRKHVVEFMG